MGRSDSAFALLTIYDPERSTLAVTGSPVVSPVCGSALPVRTADAVTCAVRCVFLALGLSCYAARGHGGALREWIDDEQLLTRHNVATAIQFARAVKARSTTTLYYTTAHTQ